MFASSDHDCTLEAIVHQRCPPLGNKSHPKLCVRPRSSLAARHVQPRGYSWGKGPATWTEDPFVGGSRSAIDSPPHRRRRVRNSLYIFSRGLSISEISRRVSSRSASFCFFIEVRVAILVFSPSFLTSADMFIFEYFLHSHIKKNAPSKT